MSGRTDSSPQGRRSRRGPATPPGVPIYEPDIYSTDAIRNPYPHFAAMRELGPVVWLPKQRLYALPRYAEVKAALGDDLTFRSNDGVALNFISRFIGDTSVLLSDGADHDRRRKLTAHRLTPRALRSQQAEIDALAEQTVLAAVAKGAVDGVDDIALKLPLTVVPDLVGWPDRGRDHLVGWAGATFDMLGPLNKLAVRSLPASLRMLAFVHRLARRQDVLPGSMADELLQSIGEGKIKRSECPAVFIDYLAPSIDTTASAIAALLWLFATFPDQWDALKADPTKVPNAVNEVVRFESPVRAFGRRVEAATRISGVDIPAGARLLVLYASANRDERFWGDPDRFDIGRDATGHVGFGHGTHGCAGQGLARIETQAILRALLQHVERIELDGAPTRAINNVVQRFETLPIRLVPRGAGA